MEVVKANDEGGDGGDVVGEEGEGILPVVMIGMLVASFLVMIVVELVVAVLTKGSKEKVVEEAEAEAEATGDGGRHAVAVVVMDDGDDNDDDTTDPRRGRVTS